MQTRRSLLCFAVGLLICALQLGTFEFGLGEFLRGDFHSFGGISTTFVGLIGLLGQARSFGFSGFQAGAQRFFCGDETNHAFAAVGDSANGSEVLRFGFAEGFLGIEERFADFLQLFASLCLRLS